MEIELDFEGFGKQKIDITEGLRSEIVIPSPLYNIRTFSDKDHKSSRQRLILRCSSYDKAKFLAVFSPGNSNGSGPSLRHSAETGTCSLSIRQGEEGVLFLTKAFSGLFSLVVVELWDPVKVVSYSGKDAREVVSQLSGSPYLKEFNAFMKSELDELEKDGRLWGLVGKLKSLGKRKEDV